MSNPPLRFLADESCDFAVVQPGYVRVSRKSVASGRQMESVD